MNHIIKLNNVYLEDCFKWMYDLVIRDGGDGSATFICDNYEEIAELFLTTYKLDEYTKLIDHDCFRITFLKYFESFTFTSNVNKLDEYTFIVERPCSEGFTPFETAITAKVCLSPIEDS